MKQVMEMVGYSTFSWNYCLKPSDSTSGGLSDLVSEFKH